MATINAVGNGLSGVSGSGNFTGNTSPTITTPTIVTSINDSNGNELLSFTPIALAVNNINISNNVAGDQPKISAEGSDSNISVVFQSKGMGNYGFSGTSGQAANIKLQENTGNGINSVGIRAPEAIATDYSLTLPDAVGASNTILKATNGTGTLSFTNGSQVLGTATNDNATTGNIGEYISSSILAGSAVSLTTNTEANLTSLSLTAGDWDLSGSAIFSPNAATVVSACYLSINTVSATQPTLATENNFAYLATISTAGTVASLNVGRMRISLSATTTVYLVAKSTFITNTQSVYGFFGARRVR